MFETKRMTLEEFERFLDNGIIIQKPNSNYLWLGIGPYICENGPFLYSSFYSSTFERYNVSKMFKLDLDDFKALCHKCLKENFTIKALSNTDNEFIKDFRSIKKLLKDSNITKLVNVSTCEYEINKSSHPLNKIDNLLSLQGSIYGKWNGGHGIIGVSPEPLFVEHDGYYRTRSLAGTISTEVDGYKDALLNDEKEIIEHRYVIEDISSTLAPFVSELKVLETTVRPFGKIAHLQTEIEFSSKNLSAKKIINLLNPTAALGGFPRKSSLNALRKLEYYRHEKESRSFGGVYGFDTQNDSFALVGIRNIFWNQKDQKAVIHSGCGVVTKSVEENELREIQKKRQVISGLFDG